MSIEGALAICAIAFGTIAIFSILVAALTMQIASVRVLQLLLNVGSYTLGLAIGFGVAAAAYTALD